MSCHATCIIGDATDHRRPEFFRQRMPHVFDQQQLRARNRRCNGLAVLDADQRIDNAVNDERARLHAAQSRRAVSRSKDRAQLAADARRIESAREWSAWVSGFRPSRRSSTRSRQFSIAPIRTQCRATAQACRVRRAPSSRRRHQEEVLRGEVLYERQRRKCGGQCCAVSGS